MGDIVNLQKQLDLTLAFRYGLNPCQAVEDRKNNNNASTLLSSLTDRV